ncbi:MAG TPA: class I SAM-dependent methyltransferase [Terricaulis sp.]|nr:class I SAM-dependent methyltransferase [Terricaulis sp.]
MSAGEKPVIYSAEGYCPICEARRIFTSRELWFRDYLACSGCGSVPRERALALMLNEAAPNWRKMSVHESSPVARGISLKLSQKARRYVGTQYFPGKPGGAMINGFRNENLEAQTFPAESFDIVVSLDVMEHVNEPERCFQEIHRTLKPGGLKIFTAPTYKGQAESKRRARYLEGGAVEHLEQPPEYHDNPVDPQGSLVTFHYGHDLPRLIRDWAAFDVRCVRFHDETHGIIGEFTEVYVCRKR